MCALAKAEKFDEALHVVERMNAFECRPDMLFLKFVHKAGRIDDVTHVFKVAMPKATVAPNTWTYNSMISMFCYYAQERDFGILKEMEKSGFCKPDIQTYHPLIEEMVDQDTVRRYKTCCLLLDEVKQKNMYQAVEKIEVLMKKL
jgi:pentatricopeptide repeat protein